MSMRQHPKATLPGWEGPLYPKGIAELATALDAKDYSGADLSRASEAVSGFVRRWRETTADGYDWFWLLEFGSGKHRVLVAIPWSQGWSPLRRYDFDRSPAVYYGDGAQGDVDRVLSQLTDALHALARASLG